MLDWAAASRLLHRMMLLYALIMTEPAGRQDDSMAAVALV